MMTSTMPLPHRPGKGWKKKRDLGARPVPSASLAHRPVAGATASWIVKATQREWRYQASLHSDLLRPPEPAAIPIREDIEHLACRHSRLDVAPVLHLQQI